MLSLTGKHHIPVIALSFDGTGFDGAFDGPMEFDLDGSDFGEADAAIMGEGEPCLRIGEAIKVSLALVAWVSWRLTPFAPGKERLERLVYFA